VTYTIPTSPPNSNTGWDSGQEMQVVDGYWKRRSGLVSYESIHPSGTVVSAA
jgi:hypothetical protein